jgi:hypothetical protein
MKLGKGMAKDYGRKQLAGCKTIGKERGRTNKGNDKLSQFLYASSF